MNLKDVQGLFKFQHVKYKHQQICTVAKKLAVNYYTSKIRKEMSFDEYKRNIASKRDSKFPKLDIHITWCKTKRQSERKEIRAKPKKPWER